jgi:hypothetical protein
MSGANVANLLIGLAVLALVLSRQLMTRRLSESYRFAVILAVIGVVQFVEFLNGHPHDDGGIGAAVGGSLVLAAAFGQEAAGQLPGTAAAGASGPGSFGAPVAFGAPGSFGR